MSSPRRCYCACAALGVGLVLPPAAFAYIGKSAPVATNFQARISGITPASDAVEAKVVNGDRALWLQAGPSAPVLVPGFKPNRCFASTAPASSSTCAR